MARILIIDDDDSFRAGMAQTLGDRGHEVLPVSSVPAALHRLQTEPGIRLAIVDLRMPGEDGLAFLRKARRIAPGLPCVMLTAYADGPNTIEAMRLGAFDHLTKPIGRDALLTTVERALDAGQPDDPARSRGSEPALDDQVLVGHSPAMREVLKRIGQAAASDATVLVLGETGTGKELVARALHRHGTRHDRAFVGVNCAAVPEELMESELFGHVKGAFTGATQDRAGRFREADGGTLLLDEIGDMTLAMQAKMLRVLQEREVTPVGSPHRHPVDVRVVAATHRDLPEAVAAGRFREDLWYRLQVLPIRLPPLRERTEDIPVLADRFLRDIGARKSLSSAAMRTLMAHRWPGNVRELRNAIERAVALTPGPAIAAEALGLAPEARASDVGGLDVAWDGPLDAALVKVEREMLSRALAQARGNRAEAARRLGLHRQQLYRKLEAHGLA